MDGETAAGASHTVARMQAGNAFAYGQHLAGGRVAQSHGLFQAIARRFQRGEHAIALGLFPHLFHQIGPRAGFLHQIFGGEVGDHALGAGRDQAGGGADEHKAGAQSRGGGLHHAHFAAIEFLDELFHVSAAKRRWCSSV